MENVAFSATNQERFDTSSEEIALIASRGTTELCLLNLECYIVYIYRNLLTSNCVQRQV